VTYSCNATCRYCQWGNPHTQGRIHRRLDEILMPPSTLASLGTQRIVISGGEPRLHPDLGKILSYYGGLVQDVVLITNGFGLDSKAVTELLESGATGFAVSLDSIDPYESFATRSTPPRLHKEIISNLKEISKMDRIFEFGINSVVSHVTANWLTVKGLLEFGNEIKADYIKFQPVFDDGYVSRFSPDLLLTKDDVPSLREIASSLGTESYPETNPKEFWLDVAELAEGRTLSPHRCDLGDMHSMSVRGSLSICFWLNSSLYGQSSESLSKDVMFQVQERFQKEKLKCKVGYQCFCNQGLLHKWNTTNKSK
jgi:molybdenum cofactor biosynthesis enzyme MoaA